MPSLHRYNPILAFPDAIFERLGTFSSFYNILRDFSAFWRNRNHPGMHNPVVVCSQGKMVFCFTDQHKTICFAVRVNVNQRAGKVVPSCRDTAPYLDTPSSRAQY